MNKRAGNRRCFLSDDWRASVLVLDGLSPKPNADCEAFLAQRESADAILEKMTGDFEYLSHIKNVRGSVENKERAPY